MSDLWIDFAKIKSLAHCASKDGTRHVLQCVNIEFSEGKALGIATTGRILAAGLINGSSKSPEGTGAVAIPISVIKLVQPSQAILSKISDTEWKITQGSIGISFEPVKGFPLKWREVLRVKEKSNDASFVSLNPKYIESLVKSMSAFLPKRHRDLGIRFVLTNGWEGCVHLSSEEADQWFGVIMSRSDLNITNLNPPTWIQS